MAAEKSDQLLAEVQSQAGSLARLAGGCLNLLEGLEQLVHVLRLDANAGFHIEAYQLFHPV